MAEETMNLLGVEDIATRFDCDVSTVRRWLERGLIDATHVGRAWVVSLEAVEEAEQAGRVPPKKGRPFEKRK